MPIAAFIAGDRHIFFPALVAFASMQHHNPGRFEFFLSFGEADLTVRMKQLMAKYAITFVPTSRLTSLFGGIRYKAPNDGMFPAEILCNYAFPLHLKELGYVLSIKVDYDILCIAPYDTLEPLLPHTSCISALTLRSSYVLSPALQDRLLAQAGLTSIADFGLNAGFIAINNDAYCASDVSGKLAAAFNILLDEQPPVPLVEQQAIAIAACNSGSPVTDLGGKYNHRVRYLYPVQGLSMDLCNIHYITKSKPWVPLDMKVMKYFAENKQGIFPFFRNIWLEFAQSVDGFDEYCSERPLTSREVLALAMLGLGAKTRQETAQV
jgi:hypothetical protein